MSAAGFGCGGAPPHSQSRRPSAFTCLGALDARGCPTTAVVAGSRCRADPALECVSCLTLAQCVRGRWRTRPLPPRP